MAARATGTAGTIPLDAFRTNYPRQHPNQNDVCLSVRVCARVHLYVLMSACVWCLSNPHLPRLFQGYHSDRCNHQWQPWLQLRAGISIPSQPIRDEMLGNQEGQAKPYEGIPVHKHAYLQT